MTRNVGSPGEVSGAIVLVLARPRNVSPDELQQFVSMNLTASLALAPQLRGHLIVASVLTPEGLNAKLAELLAPLASGIHL